MDEDLIYARNALTYHQRGGSPLPLPPRRKKYPPEGFTGKTGRMASVDEVRDWSIDKPDANIALRLPDGVMALDVDCWDARNERPKRGAEVIRAAVEVLGPLPILGRSTSAPEVASHGHYLFRTDLGVEFRPNLNHLMERLGFDAGDESNVDIVWHGYRYLVVPPSIHEITGKPYVWVPHPRFPERSSFPPLDEIPRLPEAWVEALRDSPREAATLVGAISGGDRSDFEKYPESVQVCATAASCGIVDSALAKLEALKLLRPGETDSQGRGWHQGILDHTKTLARVCNSPWSPQMPGDLLEPLKAAMPFDSNKPLHEGMNMFLSAVAQPDGAVIPDELGAAILLDALGGIAEGETPSTEEVTFDGVTVKGRDGRVYPVIEELFPLGSEFQSPLYYEEVAKALSSTLQWADYSWVVWDGTRWVRDLDGLMATSRVMALLGNQPAMTEPKPTAKNPGAESATPISRAIRADAAKRGDFATGKVRDSEFARTAETFDGNPRVINTPNGLLDLELGTLTPHDPSMLVSRITRANYHSAAVHADLDRILSIHDAESVEYLQLILGAALTGYADHRLTLLQGPGGNGKTSLIGALAAAMGDYAFAGRGSDLADIMAGKGHMMVTALEGRRLTLFEELDREGAISASTVKRLVGGGRQGGDPKFKEHRGWNPTSSVIINSNSMPRLTESDSAIRRRLRAVPLSGVVPENQQDPNIEYRLRTEQAALDAVFSWAVEGARKYFANGGVLPSPEDSGAAVSNSSRIWFNESDMTGQFIAATLAPTSDPEEWVPLKEVRERFETFWLEERGKSSIPYSPQRLYGEMRDRGVEVFEAGSAAKAKRKATVSLLAKINGNARQAIEVGETVTPVRGWGFVEPPESAGVSADALLSAIERQQPTN